MAEPIPFPAHRTFTTGVPPSTLPALFERSVAQFSENVFLLEKKGGAYRPSTYRQVHERVCCCAAGLMSMGVKKGDRIGLIAEGRNDWIIAELGVLYAGAVNVPLSVKIEEHSELRFRLFHAGCRMVIVSANHIVKVDSIRGDLPDLEKVILLDPRERGPACEDEVAFSGVLECGEKWLAANRGDFEMRWNSIQADDPANICYTSGTVADPKGIVLTHRNYTSNVEQSVALYPLPEWFCTLLILPWDHSFAHTDGIYALARCGGSIASVQAGKTALETLRNIPGNIREVRPTFLLSVPALAKSFRKSIESGVAEAGVLAGVFFRAGLRVAYLYHGDGRSRGKGWRRALKPLERLFDIMLFHKVREKFGGRLEYFIGGGALLDVEVQRFFCAIGIPMYQGYGLTEASPVISANTPARHKFGTSGTPAPDLQIRICDEHGRELPPGRKGEIVVRGENVMAGYWKNEKATAMTVRDGWLFTGDLGYLDPDGFLVVLGREKSLLVGHDGEKYSPEGIEETIVAYSPYIDQLMLHNSQSPYTVALAVPNREALLLWLKRHHHQLQSGTVEHQDAALRLLESEIDRFRGGGTHAGLFPERWLPSAIGVLSEPFTEQNRLLNSTLKMVRARIVASYRDRLDYLFTPPGKKICNTRNREAIARSLLPPVA